MTTTLACKAPERSARRTVRWAWRTLRATPFLALVAVGGPLAVQADEATQAPVDRLLESLAAVGLEPDDLGYRPRATWARYPHPNTTQYVLPFFEDLLARPLDTYEFVRTLGNAVEDNLTPARLQQVPTAADRAETLFRLGVLLGTERRIGGFRGYSANLAAPPDAGGASPLLTALLRVLERAGAILDPDGAFGGEYEQGRVHPRRRLAEDVARIPDPLHAPLAELLHDLLDARTWIDRGLRNISVEQREAVFASRHGLASSSFDTESFPVGVADAVPRLDEHSLHYGALKAMQAVQDARVALGAALSGLALPAFDVRIASPWGEIRLRAGTEEEVVAAEPLFCYVQVGTQTAPTRAPLGSTTSRCPLSVALLFEHGDLDGTAGGQVEWGGLGSGMLGCGVAYGVLARQGARIEVKRLGLGAALLGCGVFLSEGGNATYAARSAAQGAAWLGAGLLLDAAGDDVYELAEGDGQGFGAPGGIGVLADRSGNDRYVAEALAEKAGRADYHSAHRIAANNAQGVGSGRRADGSDGHAWAGGLGALIDVDGDDVYEAGNFSQGLGYWYGTGVLWDGGGNDKYRSVYFTQGSGAHFAVGALVDEGGNDVHETWETAGAALGFGWDVVNAFLIDRGMGDDKYTAKTISLGVANVRSNAFFIDEGGNDTYVVEHVGNSVGAVDERPGYVEPHRTAPFAWHMGQCAVFLDLGGDDAYLRWGSADNRSPLEGRGNNKDWGRGALQSPGSYNVAIARDVPSGHVRSLFGPWPAR